MVYEVLTLKSDHFFSDTPFLQIVQFHFLTNNKDKIFKYLKLVLE